MKQVPSMSILVGHLTCTSTEVYVATISNRATAAKWPLPATWWAKNGLHHWTSLSYRCVNEQQYLDKKRWKAVRHIEWCWKSRRPWWLVKETFPLWGNGFQLRSFLESIHPSVPEEKSCHYQFSSVKKSALFTFELISCVVLKPLVSWPIFGP